MKNVPHFASNNKLTCLVTPSAFSGGPEKSKKMQGSPPKHFSLVRGS